MKNLYLFGVTLLCIIIYYILSRQHYNLMEPFYIASSSKTIILLGDSILKNNDYVTEDYSVEAIIHNKSNNNVNVYCFAKNNETITDIYEQLNEVSIDYNNNSTYIFLSVGGNDILNNYEEWEEIFSQYTDLVDSIKAKMNKSNILLVDIYYPTSNRYHAYLPIIQKWNNSLYTFVNNSTNDNVNVLRISDSVTEPDDFVYDIEPSKTGGEKIARAILTI